MPFVVDASIAASWFLPDEQSEAAEALIVDMVRAPGVVPSLFWFETRNLFIMAERRGRLADGGALAAMLKLHSLPLEDSGSGNDVTIIDIAARHALSGYDASYLALAVARSLPLATADRKLAVAARAEGVLLRGPFEHDA